MVISPRTKEARLHSNTTTLLTGAGNGNGLDLASLRQMLQLNVMIVAGPSHRYGAQMKRLRPGRVLNVVLSAAYRLAPFFTAHGPSKALAVNFSDALARDIEDFGGRISGLSPDSTDTALFDEVDPGRIAGWYPFGEANCADPRGSAGRRGSDARRRYGEGGQVREEHACICQTLRAARIRGGGVQTVAAAA